MGNAGVEGECKHNAVDLCEPFISSGVQQWSIESVQDAASRAGLSRGIRNLTITLEQFLSLFPLIPPKTATRIFKQFSERFSVRDLAKLEKRASALTILTCFGLLCTCSCERKAMYVFELFDLNGSKSLSLEEATVLVSCVFRAAKTVRNTPFHCTPHTVDMLVSTLFHSSRTPESNRRSTPKGASSLRCCIVWKQFWTWAQRHLSAPLLAPFRHSCPLERCCAKGRAYAVGLEPSTHDARVEDAFRTYLDEDNGRESPRPGFESDSDTEEEDVDLSTAQVELNPTLQFRSGNQQEEEEKKEAEMVGFEEEEKEEGECGYLDYNEAMREILANLPRIDEGDHSSLGWVLQTLTILSNKENSSFLRPHVGTVLPLVCNVAACEEVSMAKLGLQVLRNVLEFVPEEVDACREFVNETALVEMLLLRCSEASLDQDVQCLSAMCLEELCRSLPYGFGCTLGVLLEAGGINHDEAVVGACASAVERILEFYLDSQDVALGGRLELLLSALSMWAHRGVRQITHISKIITIKLAIRFSEEDRWIEALASTHSPLLKAWSEGQDLSEEEEAKLMTAGPMMDFPGGIDAQDAKPRPEAERGWLVPAGYIPHTAPEHSTMYPQVFAILGFCGRGGPAVGIPERSSFDCAGSFRKRTVVVEKKTTEFAQVLWNGQVKIWQEEEEARREEIHLETAQGEFARREITSMEQKETLDGKVTASEASKKDYLHLKNETGEFAAFIHPEGPGSPQLNGDDPLGQNASAQGQPDTEAQGFPAETETKSDSESESQTSPPVTIVVEHPDSPS